MNVAIILPAFNEAATIEQVITAYHEQLPNAELIIVNNNSSDLTAQIAEETLKKIGSPGRVLTELRQGKGLAMRKAFQEVSADIFVMVDADMTYDAQDIHTLIQPVLKGEADMVVGNRHFEDRYQHKNKRPFHHFGNHFVRSLINGLFGAQLNDIMSGYRVFNQRFVKNYPILFSGFQLETDMTLHALDKRFRILEMPINYQDRPSGSVSKLNTFRDGFLVLSTIVEIFRHYRPWIFFVSLATLFLLAGLAAGTPVILEYIQFKYIFRVPLAILACGLVICSLLLAAIGLILDGLTRNHRFDYEQRLINWHHTHTSPHE